MEKQYQMRDYSPQKNSFSGGVQVPSQRNSSIIMNFTQMKQRMSIAKEITQARRSTNKKLGRAENYKPPPTTLSKQNQSEVQNTDQKQVHNKKAQDKEQKFREMDEHKIPLMELCKRYGTDPQKGLTSDAAVKRNQEQGDNRLPQKKKTPKWILFLIELTNWFSIMLWIGSILCIITYILSPSQNLPNLYLGFILIFVVLLTGVITFMQSAKSQALMDSFKGMLPQNTTVVRDGKSTQVLAQKLVRGDVVEMKLGDKVPADIRMIYSNQMKVDNSPLTGQSDPLLRTTECSHPEQPLQTKNLAFFGTLIKQGKGKGIVINIAANTILGQIADLASTGQSGKSPLRKELDRFVLLITIIALSLGIGFFLLALLVLKQNILQCLVFGIGILVANVPQGLLGCITISLAITAKRLHEKQVLVKNLQAVQTLGSTSCICSDKTGTLTQNKMTVQNLWYDSQVHRAENKQKYDESHAFQYQVEDPSFVNLQECAMICSDAKFDVSEMESKMPGFKWSQAPVLGDASQTALVKFYQPVQDILITRNKYKIAQTHDKGQAKMPFNSTNKYALTIVQQQTNDSYFCVNIKGAPQKVWSYCSRILHEGRFNEIDQEQRRKFEAVNLRFGKNGERVLGFAKLHLLKQKYPRNFNFNTSNPDNFNFRMENFVFVGLISLMDPPKDSVPFAVLKCRSAGIKVIMVTGDQPPTAAAIARQVNIISSKTVDDLIQTGMSKQEAMYKAKAIVIHGDMIVKAYQDGDQQAGQQQLMSWVKKPQCCFARTTPAQKLKIVRACQRAGNIVGVTGDGVNDSPAIKQADIGIAMGIMGSDVSKDAADMILLNDDFASIVNGVEEGRKIFDNLKKTVVYLLTSNITEIFPFLAFVALQIPLPLSNILMLVICVGTDILPALSLAYEQSEVDIMTRKPRKLDQHLVSLKLLANAYGQMGQIATAAGFFAYFVTMYILGFPPNGLIGLVTKIGYLANPSDIYDINSETFGNTAITPDCRNMPTSGNQLIYNYTPDWVNGNMAYIDLRMSLLECNRGSGRWEQISQVKNFLPQCRQIGKVFNGNNYPICYTTQSIFWGQSAYFVAIVLVQWSNIVACKSRKVLHYNKASYIYSEINMVMFYGIIMETLIFIALLYIPGINSVFGGRPLDIWTVGTPGLLFSVMLLIWVQVRKIFINLETQDGKPNWFQRHTLW